MSRSRPPRVGSRLWSVPLALARDVTIAVQVGDTDRDDVSATQLLKALRAGRAMPRLVVISSCHSAEHQEVVAGACEPALDSARGQGYAA